MTTKGMPQTARQFEHLAYLHEAVAVAATLAAADQLGILARLEAGPVDVPTLALDCGLSERGTCSILAGLASLGLIEAERGSRRYASCVTALSRQVGALMHHWEPLGEALRTGYPAIAVDSPAGAEAIYADIVEDLGAWFAALAEEAAGHFAIPGARVLDVGAGGAPWSLALARRDPTTQVTAVDLPAVLPATRRAVAAAGYQAQYGYLGGDMFTVGWEEQAFDVAIAGNVCHLFGETANRSLLQRLYHALRPGGRLVIVDVVPNERLDSPRSAVLYALSLMLRTREGAAYPFSTYAAWLRDAGYEAIERYELAKRPALTLITARHPGILSTT